RLGLPLAADVLEDLLAALPERRARWTEGIEGAAEQRHDRRGRGERDVGIERLVMVRTHLPLDGSEGGVRWWRRGREPRVAPVEGPLDLGDEAPERDLARARDPGVVSGGHGEDGQRAQPRDGAPAVGGGEHGRPAEPALERDQGAGLARREAEALGDVARRRRETEGAVQAEIEEGAEEDAHLPVDALHGAPGGAQALVERERVRGGGRDERLQRPNRPVARERQPLVLAVGSGRRGEETRLRPREVARAERGGDGGKGLEPLRDARELLHLARGEGEPLAGVIAETGEAEPVVVATREEGPREPAEDAAADRLLAREAAEVAVELEGTEVAINGAPVNRVGEDLCGGDVHRYEGQRRRILGEEALPGQSLAGTHAAHASPSLPPCAEAPEEQHAADEHGGRRRLEAQVDHRLLPRGSRVPRARDRRPAARAEDRRQEQRCRAAVRAEEREPVGGGLGPRR